MQCVINVQCSFALQTPLCSLSIADFLQLYRYCCHPQFVLTPNKQFLLRVFPDISVRLCHFIAFRIHIGVLSIFSLSHTHTQTQRYTDRNTIIWHSRLFDSRSKFWMQMHNSSLPHISPRKFDNNNMSSHEKYGKYGIRP